jgi:hypothetical protein
VRTALPPESVEGALVIGRVSLLILLGRRS